MPATARHILVQTEEECLKLKREIEEGADFAEVAKANSYCPSRMRGGDLGAFVQGQMVKEFDDVVFSGEINKVLGPGSDRVRLPPDRDHQALVDQS